MNLYANEITFGFEPFAETLYFYSRPVEHFFNKTIIKYKDIIMASSE